MSHEVGQQNWDAEILTINEKLMNCGVHIQELIETARKSEASLREMVNGLGAVICEVETLTGKPVFLSMNEDYFLGQSLESWYGHPSFLTAIIHPKDRDRATSLITELTETGQDYEYEFRAFSSDSESIWMRNIVRVVHGPAGKIKILRCVIVDVTAQRNEAQELEKSLIRESYIADTLQRSLLFMPAEDFIPGLAVSTLYKTAFDEARLGGDFWDTFTCDRDKVALVLGDVMGHGLPAAIFTTEYKFALRGFIREHKQPARILKQMNAHLCESYNLNREGLIEEGYNSPVCIILAIIDTKSGQGLIASAGMEPALLIHRDGQMEELQVNGLLLGIEINEEYNELPFQLEQDDQLLMITDGVTESRWNGKILGYDGLMRLAQEGRSLGTLEKTGQSILEGAKAFAGGCLRDDACVLLARRQ